MKSKLAMYTHLTPFLFALPLLGQEIQTTTPIPSMNTSLVQPTIIVDTISAKDVEIAFLKKEITRLENALTETKSLLNSAENKQINIETVFTNCRVDLGIAKANLDSCQSDRRLQLILGSVSSVTSVVAGASCLFTNNTNPKNP
jgi:hypothetical protein